MVRIALPACLVAPMLSACVPATTESAERFVATGELIALSGGDAGAANACFTCHGANGQGDGAFTPRLAGLDAGYLERQLAAYANGQRVHPQMNDIAERLDGAQQRRVSAYYAAMPPAPTRPAEQGRADIAALYHNGDPDRGLVACAACHGPEGGGAGPANPPLAGQPRGYLAAQLDHWRRSSRRSDPGAVMLRISQLLTPAESAGLAAYASGLAGGPPSRVPPEAFPAARRGDPRSGASAPPLHVPERARAAAR